MNETARTMRISEVRRNWRETNNNKREGNRFVVCMRDDGLEIGLYDTSIKSANGEKYLKWFMARDGNIKEECAEAKSNIKCEFANSANIK